MQSKSDSTLCFLDSKGSFRNYKVGQQLSKGFYDKLKFRSKQF